MSPPHDIAPPQASSGAPKYTIGSILTGMKLLDVLASAGEPMKLKDLAAAADMPAAKAHRYLATFGAAGMVAQSGRSGAYDLGPMALRIGLAALRRDDVIDWACTNLATLRDEIRATCFVCGWSDRGPIILRWLDSQQPVTVIVQVGSIMPLLGSATGRIFLSYLPRAQTEAVAAAEMAESGNQLSSATMDELVRETRAAGQCHSQGILQEGIAALAVPLFDALGNAVGSITAIGWSNEFDVSADGANAHALQRYAESATAGSGQRGPI